MKNSTSSITNATLELTKSLFALTEKLLSKSLDTVDALMDKNHPSHKKLTNISKRIDMLLILSVGISFALGFQWSIYLAAIAVINIVLHQFFR